MCQSIYSDQACLDSSILLSRPLPSGASLALHARTRRAASGTGLMLQVIKDQQTHRSYVWDGIRPFHSRCKAQEEYQELHTRAVLPKQALSAPTPNHRPGHLEGPGWH